MGLTPDEIAHRAFTPSADGYHQGEVREFLSRVAAQLHGVLSAFPENQSGSDDELTTLSDREPRPVEANLQLDAMLVELRAATALVEEARNAAASQLVATQLLATDQAAILTEHRAAAEQLVEATKQSAEQLDAVFELTAAQHDVASNLAAANEQAATNLATMRQLNQTPEVETDPAPVQNRAGQNRTQRTSPPSGGTLSLFASDFDDEPLFSDSANDLLDGVLDDVMGNINDEGDQS